jgi:hypothetical protein
VVHGYIVRFRKVIICKAEAHAAAAACFISQEVIYMRRPCAAKVNDRQQPSRVCMISDNLS